MSYYLNAALDDDQRAAADAADAGPVIRQREPVQPVVLTDAECAAMDDMGCIADMRNVLVRAEFVARIRRFDSRFGVLT